MGDVMGVIAAGDRFLGVVNNNIELDSCFISVAIKDMFAFIRQKNIVNIYPQS